MDTKTLNAAAKHLAKTAGAFSTYVEERAEKRKAFDVETARKTAELRAEMDAAKRAYRTVIEEIAGDLEEPTGDNGAGVDAEG